MSGPNSRLLPTIFLVITLIVTLFITGVALANQPIKLLVNNQEITTDVPPQVIEGRVMVPVRCLAEALGAKIHWDEKKRTIEVFTEDWLFQLKKLLDQAGEEFLTAPDVKGEIRRLWRVGENYILLENVWHRDYDYWLGNTSTGQKDWIIPFTENARVEKIEDQEIVFVAKGGGDGGDYDFPYLLRYDLKNKELSSEQIYLQREVTFGTLGWDLLLQDVHLQDEAVILNLKVAPGQVLAGGFRKPLTIVGYQDNLISIRIYSVTPAQSNKQALEPTHPLIKKVEWKALPPDKPVENPALLQMDFPYGALLKNINFNRPSIEVKIYTKEKVAYNISTNVEDNHLTYTVKFKPPSAY